MLLVSLSYQLCIRPSFSIPDKQHFLASCGHLNRDFGHTVRIKYRKNTLKIHLSLQNYNDGTGFR